MEELKKPQKVKDMAWEKTAEAYVLVDKENNKTYSLDPIAFLVWVQCDGKTDVEKIVDVFAVDGNRDIVKAAIGGIIDKLATTGLVKWVL